MIELVNRCNVALMSSTEKIRAKNAALLLAKQILTSEVGLLLGIRKILPNLYALGIEHHPDFIILVGIDSQHDHLPTGPERTYWNEDALAEKDVKIKEAEHVHRENAMKACEALIVYLEALEV